jgi:uncharacterized membrane protein
MTYKVKFIPKLREFTTTKTQNVFRIILGLFMLLAAIGHLSFQRTEFQSQVPDWVPMNKDLVVILSGIVEGAFGLAMIFYKSKRVWVGIALAVFFILIFPGNIGQYLNKIDAFGLDTDSGRLTRLFFQPLLVL